MKDVYLREQMDAEGFVPIKIISKFRRVRNMTRDMNQIHTAVKQSALLQVKTVRGITYIRPIDNPTQWIIPASALRHSVAQLAAGPMPVKKGYPGSGEALNLNPDVAEFVPKKLMNGAGAEGNTQSTICRICQCQLVLINRLEYRGN